MIKDNEDKATIQIGDRILISVKLFRDLYENETIIDAKLVDIIIHSNGSKELVITNEPS